MERIGYLAVRELGGAQTLLPSLTSDVMYSALDGRADRVAYRFVVLRLPPSAGVAPLVEHPPAVASGAQSTAPCYPLTSIQSEAVGVAYV